jgi:hypothetical protein
MGRKRKHVSKRQKITKRVPLNFFQWTCVFLNQTFECDTPILESIYHTMFVYLDLVKILHPDLLYADIKEKKAPLSILKDIWWSRVERLAGPKLENLVPVGSHFDTFNRWFGCVCKHQQKYVVGFPLKDHPELDEEGWKIHCDSCVHHEQDPCDPISLHSKQSINLSEALRISMRRELRGGLKTARELNLCYYGWGRGKSGDRQLIVEQTPLCPIIIAPGFDRIECGVEVGPRVRCDFITACMVLSRPKLLINLSESVGVPDYWKGKLMGEMT